MHPIPGIPQTITPDVTRRMRKAAEAFEASFLAEMLKSAGLGANRNSFGGGVGEEQFGDFLVRAQARELARHGGIGLADLVFQALVEKTNGAKH